MAVIIEHLSTAPASTVTVTVTGANDGQHYGLLLHEATGRADITVKAPATVKLTVVVSEICRIVGKLCWNLC